MGLQSVCEESAYAEINRAWIVEKLNYIKIKTKGSFVNFPLAELAHSECEYYGENVEKLKGIRKNMILI